MRQRAEPDVRGIPTFGTQAAERVNKGDEEGEVTEIRRKTEEYSVMEGKVKQYFKWDDKGREMATGLENIN